MTLDPRRAALWDALGLGPRWVLRAAEPDAEAEWPAQEALHAQPPVVAAATPAAPSAARPVSAAPVPPRSGGARTNASVAATVEPADAERAQRIATLDWDGLRAEVAACRACALCKSRTQTVFAAGGPGAPWLIVGEAPGAEEDARGEPFVGQAGRLLDAMLGALGLARGREVTIVNVLKCRPPGNRNPEPEEVAACAPFLARQIELAAPAVLLIAGRYAAQSLLATDSSIASLRGRIHGVPVGQRQVPAIVTYHPAYLLRNLVDKAKSWADLCLARRAARDAGADRA
ncbi:MAG TPA: uracil-DNA glycosylase [Burkholderiaceae bacterium]|nr:uracil-DNA glycosylase [Burkholderiaceae bacterium]